ncbi:MAG: hypothetical protein ABIH39_01530 [Candidatus Margulisiibacteriota bacterium]
MSSEQWSTGLITLTNASQIVVGSASCDWRNQIEAPNVLKRNADGEATYTIATVLTATRLLLSSNYAGTTGTGLEYIVCRSFTTNRGYWRPLQGDSDWAEIMSQETIDKIDTDIANIISGAASLNLNIRGFKFNPLLKTANYQITGADNLILGSGDITITLASASDKQQVKIANRSLDVNASILISKSGGDTVEGNTSVKLKNKYDSVVLIGDGTNTHIEF